MLMQGSATTLTNGTVHYQEGTVLRSRERVAVPSIYQTDSQTDSQTVLSRKENEKMCLFDLNSALTPLKFKEMHLMRYIKEMHVRYRFLNIAVHSTAHGIHQLMGWPLYTGYFTLLAEGGADAPLGLPKGGILKSRRGIPIFLQTT